MTVSIIVSTFGDRSIWHPLACRAIGSAEKQTVKSQVIYVHGASLQDARNAGAARAEGDWLIFLDADDELDPGYVEAMEAGTGDLRQPATLGVVDGREDPFPVVIPKKPLLDGNYMVIGTMCRKDLFGQVGGFDDWPIYEDWDLWIRMWLLGAVPAPCPEAIYRVHVQQEGRNSQDRATQVKYYNAIRQKHLPVARAKRLA
jgi:glycosyltransferase involved in cell wall biosynthesis